MNLTAKQIGIISAIVFILLLTIGIYFYYQGKKKTTIKEVPKDTPPGGENNPSGVSSGEIFRISNALYDDMNGLNVWGHDILPYQDFNALSDTDFVKVYNQFNTEYQGDSKATLKQWIDSEMYVFDDVVESIKKRMGRLNLI